MLEVVDARPYPWPYDGLPAPERIALVLVGPQAGFQWMDVGSAVQQACTALHASTAGAGMPVVFIRLGRTRATPGRLPGIPEPDSAGWAWLRGLTPGPSDLVVDAPAFDGFYGTSLDAALRSMAVRHLVFAGFGTETAVHSTLRDANDRGYECLVLDNACADIDSALHRNSMSCIEMSGGIFGAYATCEAFLATITKERS